MDIFRSFYRHLSSEKYDTPFIVALLLFETVLCTFVVNYISYTEIDWIAYMQEVTCWQDGERDYLKIRGDTGPLVYPAGFLYLYGVLKWFGGGDGSDIRTVQNVFCGLYVANTAVVLSIYKIVARSLCEAKNRHGPYSNLVLKDTNVIWYWRFAMIICCLSKRVHSIFILRLFNDAPAMLLLHVSVYLFMKSRWRIGCVFFSLAVSVKMNVLLFAPGLLLLLLQSSQNVIEVFYCLGICAGIQIILGLPFLTTHPASYIRKAFELDRVFTFKWTVNWKFLPENIFISKSLSLLLLSMHLCFICIFCYKWLVSARRERYQIGKNSIIFLKDSLLSPEYIASTLFVSNFIGVAFARSLHYQFYSWYFYSLPLLLWLTNFPLWTKVILLGIIEYAFNIFPATVFSSLVLQLAHFSILFMIWRSEVPTLCIRGKDSSKQS